MDSQKIVDYVMNTPHNTNSTILKQMIEESNGAGSSSGTVNSINDILPDERGNVEIGWNDLADKPLKTETSEMVIVGKNGPPSIPSHIKVSDYVPTLADFNNGGVMNLAHGVTVTFTAEDVIFGDYFNQGLNNSIYVQDAYFCVVTEDFIYNPYGMTVTPGIYFKASSSYKHTLTIYPAKNYLDTEVVAIKWEDLIDKPAEYPSNWEQVSNKPDEFTSNWDILNNKPLKDIADIVISKPTGNFATTSYEDFVNISSQTPTVEELSNGFDITFELGGGSTKHYTADDIVVGDYFNAGIENVYSKDLSFMIFYEDCTMPDGADVRKGTHFSRSQYVKTLTVNPRTILDQDKIKVSWDGITNIPDFEFSKYLPKATAVDDVTNAPTAEDFNALLAALRDAGYLAT